MTQPQVKLPALFHLVRDVDETGVSGTGTVARGVEMANGSCLMQWTVSPAQSIDEGIVTVLSGDAVLLERFAATFHIDPLPSAAAAWSADSPSGGRSGCR